MKSAFPVALLIAAFACAPAQASSHGAPAKKAHQAKGQSNARESVPDISGMEPTAYDCDVGDKLTIYKHPGDDQQIALQWNKRTHRMHRMPTTTGAERYENQDNGLVWIGIPAKGILLDSKKGRQLANECRNAEQKKQLVQK